MAKKVSTYHLSEPLNGLAAAKVEIILVDGNLSVDHLAGGEHLLASGALQYLENQAQPTSSISQDGGLAHFILKAGGKGQPWIRLPWSACNSATEWQVSLNPSVALDITAHTGGGNIHLDLVDLTLTSLAADTGGGNIQVILPKGASGLTRVVAKSGAGNVEVLVPNGLPARIHAKSGIGKVILDPQFARMDANTYQSPNFKSAVDQVEIFVESGAGNVVVTAQVAIEKAAALHM